MITTLLERADLLRRVEAELVEDPGLDHLGRILLAVQHLVEDAVAHVALDAFGHVVALADHGLHGLLAHDHVLAVEEHDAGRDAVPLGVDQGDRLAPLVQLGEDGERRSQVDADGGNRWNLSCWGAGTRGGRLGAGGHYAAARAYLAILAFAGRRVHREQQVTREVRSGRSNRSSRMPHV